MAWRTVAGSAWTTDPTTRRLSAGSLTSSAAPAPSWDVPATMGAARHGVSAAFSIAAARAFMAG